MTREGYCLNSVQDPIKRAAILEERIGLLKIRKAEIDDEIEIMDHELHGVTIQLWLDRFEASIRPGAP